jgi:cytochrome oxidase Cu insertion factor (SCO1/SenC/PrrC family)
MKNLTALTALILLLLAVACSPTASETAAPAPEQAMAAGETEAMTGESEAMSGDGAMPAEGHDAADSEGEMTAATAEPMMDGAAEGDHSMAGETAEMMDATAPAGGEPAMDASAENTDAAMAAPLPAWGQLALTNAVTGEPFTLADFSGKTVFVEPMATWCTNCRAQLDNVSQARAGLDPEQVVFVALSVETTISDGELAAYAQNNGYDWVFAVMTPEMLAELANSFGRTVTNPPSTPHFIIRPDGGVTDLVTGIESPDEIAAAVSG